MFVILCEFLLGFFHEIDFSLLKFCFSLFIFVVAALICFFLIFHPNCHINFSSSNIIFRKLKNSKRTRFLRWIFYWFSIIFGLWSSLLILFLIYFMDYLNTPWMFFSWKIINEFLMLFKVYLNVFNWCGIRWFFSIFRQFSYPKARKEEESDNNKNTIRVENSFEFSQILI